MKALFLDEDLAPLHKLDWFDDMVAFAREQFRKEEGEEKRQWWEFQQQQLDDDMDENDLGFDYDGMDADEIDFEEEIDFDDDELDPNGLREFRDDNEI